MKLATSRLTHPLSLLPLTALLLIACGESQPGDDPERGAGRQEKPIGQSESTQPGDDVLDAALTLSGEPRRNRYLQLQAARAGFVTPAREAPPGLRYFVVRLRGTSRSRDDVELPIQPFVFAQNDRGCISRPEMGAQWLPQPFGEIARFSASTQTVGDLAFLVPRETRQVRVLIATTGGDGFAVSAGEEFEPAWPDPVMTIEDGSTLRVHVLPRPDVALELPPPAAEHEYVPLDVVIENLQSTQGIEFTTSQQLRLVDPMGRFVQPSPATGRFACRLDDGDLVPPGNARRFFVVYEMPVGVPIRLEYRGFELDSTIADIHYGH